MSQNPKPESISSKNNYPIIFISPGGRVFTLKFDREILEIMSALNVYDEEIKKLTQNENNDVVSFCG